MCAKCKVRLGLSVQVLLLFGTCVVRGFNVDTENFNKYSGDRGSMFGFSVAQHKERGSNWLLIGAPEADTSQPGVKRGGAVYRCDISRDDYCQPIPFDRTGNNNNSDYRQLDSKSYQWFGATVRSSGEDGVIVACAPRYVWYSQHMNRRDPVGTCYVAKNQMSDFSEFSPCRTRNWGYHRQGSCQAGLGASISKDGTRLFIGAVGSWYWQGQVHSCDSYARLPRLLPPRYTVYGEEGQMISQNLYSRPDVISSNEGPTTEDDSYLGYSVAAGDFSGGGGQNDVAVGMPRGAGLQGKIVLFSWNLTNLQNITGEQMGAYFGYSLAAVDMDGDKLDDLVIGAPLYTDLSNNEGDYETGRIYVVYQGAGTQKFRSSSTRDGFNSKSRFGLALAALGDINKDGYGDVAVGAPYDGVDERGHVYIFHGSVTGIREKPSQIITSSDIGLPLSTFGFSLSGGVDMDENQYPDLIVGAYESDTAVFLRARPVVKMMASVSFLSDQKQVVLEEQNCTLKDRTRVACLSLKMCLEYSGLGVEPSLDFDVQLILDSKKQKSPRMSFLSVENLSVQNQTIPLDKGVPRCQEVFVYIKPGIRDKLTALEAEMRYSLHSSASAAARRRYQRSLAPVLDLNEPLSRKDSISIQKNCGKDNICIPNLRIIATPNVKRYLLGSGERLFVDVVVMNEGEDAFESVFDMKIPAGINYVNIERVDNERDVLVQCSAPSFINNNTLHCDIGNPLPKEKTVHFKVILQPFHKPGMKPRYEFDIGVNSTNPENKTSSDDNVQNLVVHIWVETDLILQGTSYPATIHYNTTLYSDEENLSQESEIGPQVVHVYSIRNKGPSDILEAEVHFLWPTSTLAHDNLLYLLEQPETNGPIKCELAPNVNPLKLTLDRKRKSYLELGGVQGALTSSSSFSSSGSSDGNGYSEEHSSSSSSSSSFSSSSSSSSRGKEVNTASLTAEERRRLEEAERRDREEAGQESGDGSQRQNKRIQTSASRGGGYTQTSSSQSSSSRGSSFTSQSGGSQGHEESSRSGGGLRVEGGSYGGRGGQGGTYISERGRVEVSGAGLGRTGGSFDTYNSFDSERKTDASNRNTQASSRPVGSNIEPGVGVSVSRGRYGNEERIYRPEQAHGYTETHYAGGNDGGRRVTGGESSSGQNQSYSYGSQGSYGSIPVSIGGNQNRTFSREEHRSSNTTWNSESGGKPITHTSSSWSENENGVIRSGSSSDSHEASNVNIGDLTSRGSQVSSSRAGTNDGRQGSSSTVSRQFSSESEHRSRSESIAGGNQRGGAAASYGSESNRRQGASGTAVSYGSESDRRQGASGTAASYGSESDRRQGASGTAASYGSESDRRQGSSGTSYGQNSRGSYETNIARDTSSNFDSARSSGSSGYDSGRNYNVGSSSSTYDSRRTQNAGAGSFGSSSGSSSSYDTRRGQASGQNSGSSSSQFDALAGIAAGPRDGVARTYSFDVHSENNGRTSGGSSHGTIAGIAAGSRDSSGATAQTYNADGSVNYRGGAGSQYGNSSSSSHRSSWSSSGGGGRHYESKAWNSEEGDNVEYDSSKDRRYPAGRDNVDYDNDRRGGTGGSSWSSGSSWESKSVSYGGSPDVLSRQARIRNYPQTSENIVGNEEPGLQQKFKLYPRYRRQVGEEESLEDIDCGPIECSRIRCTVGPLTKDQEASVAFRSRLWIQTLKKFALHPEVQLSSLVAGRVTKLPHIGAPDQSSVHTHEVITQVVPRDTGSKPDVVPLWIVVLSACAGALILMLLVYLLYKCGFFKRNRPSSDVPEKQPLNRNGHYQSGDEAL